MQGTTILSSGQPQPTIIKGQPGVFTPYGGITGTKTLASAQQPSFAQGTSFTRPSQTGYQPLTSTTTYNQGVPLGTSFTSVQGAPVRQYSGVTTLGPRSVTSTATPQTNFAQGAPSSGITITSNLPSRTLTSVTGTPGQPLGQPSTYTPASGTRIISGQSNTLSGATRPSSTNTYPASTFEPSSYTPYRPTSQTTVVQQPGQVAHRLDSNSVARPIETTQVAKPAQQPSSYTPSKEPAQQGSSAQPSPTATAPSYQQQTAPGAAIPFREHTIYPSQPQQGYTAQPAPAVKVPAYPQQTGPFVAAPFREHTFYPSVAQPTSVYPSYPQQTPAPITVSQQPKPLDVQFTSATASTILAKPTEPQATQEGYALDLEDDEDEDNDLEDRRFTEDTARTLARILFGRYDEGKTGTLTSVEASTLITDFYCSLDINHPSNRREGFDFLVANDMDNDGEFSLRDFEEIFVQHLSTGSNQSGYRLFSDKKVSAVKAEFAVPAPISGQEYQPAITQAQPVIVSQGAGVESVRPTENSWEQENQALLAEIREKGRQEGFEKGQQDALQMGAHLQQPGATNTYDEGYKLGLQYGLQDGQARAEEAIQHAPLQPGQ